MRIWLYEVGEKLIINEKVKRYLPYAVGKEVTVIEKLTNGSFDYLVVDEHKNEYRVREVELDRLGDMYMDKQLGKFEIIATELGKFTDEKNKQYGSSVDATYEMMLVLMDRYKNEDSTYTIPKELIKQMLLTVRVMDKQNRIFNNPSGKGDSESPWKDIVGYGLIGVNMTNK
ncbi:YorP family protein [Niallia sp. FSL W8-0951]|uniref:YorP family protein n=1 Tax=Niallia sp. FSL W8-0951 TaxID=2954639 RepID=UPI0030F9A1EC